MNLRRSVFEIKHGLKLAAMALVLAASQTTAHADPVKGGTLRLLVSSEPASLSLGFASGSQITINTKIREGLLVYDLDLKPKASLATQWSVSPDGKDFTFKLREGVLWHDGQPFKAEDVVFTFNYFKAVRNNILVNYASAEAVDDHTVVVRFSEPAPYLLTLLGPSQLPILPAHAYKGLDTDGIRKSDVLIGTGPFVFKEWERASHVTLERNANYWDKPKPYLDRIVFPFIPDSAGRTLALETGEVDLGSETPVARNDIARLKKIPGLEFETRGYERNPLVIHIGFNLDNPKLADIRVRQAIAHVVDKQRILDTAWYGQGTLTDSFIPPDHRDFYEKNVTTYPYNIDEANRLLDEAGAKRDANGIRFTLTYVHFPGESLKKLGDILKSELTKVGIDLTVKTQDQAGFFKSVWGDNSFEIYGHSNNAQADPAISIPRAFLSTAIEPGVTFSNATKYRNSEVDRLLKSGASEPDLPKRIQYYSEFQKIAAREIPIYPILVQQNFTIASKKVKDHTVNAEGVAKGSLSDTYLTGQ